MCVFICGLTKASFAAWLLLRPICYSADRSWRVSSKCLRFPGHFERLLVNDLRLIGLTGRDAKNLLMLADLGRAGVDRYAFLSVSSAAAVSFTKT